MITGLYMTKTLLRFAYNSGSNSIIFYHFNYFLFFSIFDYNIFNFRLWQGSNREIMSNQKVGLIKSYANL